MIGFKLKRSVFMPIRQKKGYPFFIFAAHE